MLLGVRIRRISLFDISNCRRKWRRSELNSKECQHLKNVTKYAIGAARASSKNTAEVSRLTRAAVTTKWRRRKLRSRPSRGRVRSGIRLRRLQSFRRIPRGMHSSTNSSWSSRTDGQSEAELPEGIRLTWCITGLQSATAFSLLCRRKQLSQAFHVRHDHERIFLHLNRGSCFEADTPRNFASATSHTPENQPADLRPEETTVKGAKARGNRISA